MNNFCIQTENLTKQFGQKLALNNFSLEIEQGGIHAIVGSNGAGKSTLFRILLGMLTPTQGSASILGSNCSDLSPSMRGRIGYVNEEHTLPGWMTSEAVTELQRSFYPDWDDSIQKRVIGYFDVDPKQKVAGLSRGERAGLNLSLALAQRPELLILDEPTLGLDVVAKQSLLEALMYIGTEYDSTLIYCSHQMEEIERVADKLILMERGQLISNSTPEDFVSRVSGWMVDFDGRQVDVNAIPGLLVSKRIDDHHLIVVTDQDDSCVELLEAQGAISVQPSPINLEKAVNAFLARNHSKPVH